MTTARIARPAERWRTKDGKEVEVIAWTPQPCGFPAMRTAPGHGPGKCRMVAVDTGGLYCSKSLGETGTLIDWPGRGA